MNFGLLFLLEDGSSDGHVLRLACQGKRGKEGLCVFIYILRDFGLFHGDILSLP